MIEYMHEYLDNELSKENEVIFRNHLESCKDCQNHFNELKRTVAMIQSANHIQAPPSFSSQVMANLPKEKRRVGINRWFKSHPALSAAAIFFIFMFGGFLSSWNQNQDLSVNQKQNILIEDNTVIVPEEKVISGDLVVKNGDLKIKGKVKGDVTIINGKILNEDLMDGEKYMASAGEVTGDIKQVDQVFEWIWFQIKSTTKEIFSFNNN